MDEITQNDGNVEASPAVEGQEDTEVAAQAPEAEQASTEDGASGETQEASEDDLGTVKDENGEEFIPKKAFDARIAKMTAQKHNAVAEFLSAAQSDPEVAEQLRQVLGVQPNAKAEEPPKDDIAENLPFLSYLDKNVQKEYHPMYRGLFDSFAETLMPRLQSMVEERLNPMMSYIGKQEVSAFVRANPDAQALMPKLQQIVSSGRARNLQDAYVLETHAAKLKGAGAAAVKSEKARQAKITNTPVKRGAGTTGDTTRAPKSFAEARDLVLKRYGINR